MIVDSLASLAAWESACRAECRSGLLRPGFVRACAPAHRNLVTAELWDAWQELLTRVDAEWVAYEARLDARDREREAEADRQRRMAQVVAGKYALLARSRRRGPESEDA